MKLDHLSGAGHNYYGQDDRGQRNDQRWSQGQRLPDRYMQSAYRVGNYRQLGLRQPGRNQRWAHDDNNNFYLVVIATGIIVDALYGAQGQQQQGGQRWSRGDRLPPQYLQNRYYVSDYSQLGLRRPMPGQRWVRDDNNSYYLVVIATGIITDVLYRNDRDQRWNQRHNRTYTYNDDVYYQQCRTSADPAGVIIGALIGGLIGNAAGNRNNTTATTAAGVILGGALGAAMTKNMDCNDRSYAYKTYYNGLNAGRSGARYQWQNPANGHRGEFNVGRYYNDPDNFRCADFTQVIYINGRPENARGTACRQPDGSWAIVN